MTKITVGTTRKVGLPRYSSLGAGCEVTLDAPDPLADPVGFADRVHRAFAACNHAVRVELARRRQRLSTREEITTGDGGESPCTTAQSRALTILCRRKGLDLDTLAQARFAGGGEPLTSMQAAALIVELQVPDALAV
jgi:hypothetical protein